MSGIKENDFIASGLIVILVLCQKFIGTKIRIHGADAIHKHVWTTIFIINRDMRHDPLMQIFHELLTMGMTLQCAEYLIARIGLLLFFLEQILQHGVELEKLLSIEVVTELFKQVEREHIHIIRRTDKVLFELLYLLTDILFLLCLILVDEEIIE